MNIKQFYNKQITCIQVKVILHLSDTFLNRFKMIREFGLIEGTWELLPSSTAKCVYIFSNKLHGNIHSPLFNVVFQKINVLNKTST